MKNIVVIALVLIIAGFAEARTKFGKAPLNLSKYIPLPGLEALDSCTVEEVAMGFFTGTEPDPEVPNSQCVLYFPTLTDQFDLVMNSYNLTALLPNNTLKVLDESATLINKYSLWQNYCTFGTLFTALDNVLETFDGFVAVVYRVVFSYAQFLIFIGDMTTAYNRGNCFDTFKAVGEIVSLGLSFEIPEDIV